MLVGKEKQTQKCLLDQILIDWLIDWLIYKGPKYLYFQINDILFNFLLKESWKNALQFTSKF